MKRCSIAVLRSATVVAGIAILALCCGGTWAAAAAWDADLRRHGVMIAMLGGLYLTAAPCFLALHQAMRLLDCIASGRAFSQRSVEALKKIERCALAAFAACTIAGLPFFCFWANTEDAPGLIVIGIALDGGAFAGGVLASIIGRLLQDAIEIKAENELTV